MREVARRVIQWWLRVCASRVIFRFQPAVVAVTGSVGKTSTVQASALVLGNQPRASPKNYNNEIGVPLAVLGLESGGRSPWRWLAVLTAALWLAYGPRRAYPPVLLLELGADKPGDLAALLRWLKPRIGVVTRVSAAHLEQFGNLAGVAAEKGELIARLSAVGAAVLNADDPLVWAMRHQTAASVITFGFGPRADVRAQHIERQVHPTAAGFAYDGLRCQVVYQGQEVILDVPRVLAEEQLSVALAALAVGISLGVPLPIAAARLSAFSPPPGRLRLIAAVKGAMMLDDSYNSSPAAAQAAVRLLSQLPTADGRKFAVLGDMLELGRISGRAHRELGGQVARAKIDLLVTVGERSRDIARGALAAGLPEERVLTFPVADAAGKFLQNRIRAGDLLLVKGSQGVRMERVVLELMAEPQRASELLVRQGPEW